jgi:hypothetical protein
VFEDVNGNGDQDPGEPGIEDVDVAIFDSSGGSQTVTTDENGMYMAVVPSGPAVVDIDEDTLPPGATQTAGEDPTRLVVPPGGSATDEDGFQVLGEVEGVVFEDTNGNGEQDANEPGIEDVDVVITDSSGETLTLTTDENGEYSAEVPRGPTEIDIDEDTVPDGFVQTAGENPTTVIVPGGGTATDEDGYQPPQTDAPTKSPTPRPTKRPTPSPTQSPTQSPTKSPTKSPTTPATTAPTKSPTVPPTGKVKGLVFEDVNGNGEQDPGEPGIEDVDVSIFDSSGGSQTVTTDENGMYMAVVPSGPAVVDIDEDTLPPGATQTAGEDPTRVVVPAGGTATDEDGFQISTD